MFKSSTKFSRISSLHRLNETLNRICSIASFIPSGNSPNVVKALEVGAYKGMVTFALLGFSGGRCKMLAQHPIHFAVDDMQIAEDLQLIVGHICMQWLNANPPAGRAGARPSAT